ncbi:MAG TPA: hypothetical protein VFX38_07045 [Gammaproteobacteria bacterium]|nr:hypothetical protein [Gammaproteobacteria bacterium]
MKPPLVELVYFSGCPQVAAAREALRVALAAEGLPCRWREWDRDDPAIPPPLRRCASPTILVNGRDVEPAVVDAAACRVFSQAAAPWDRSVREAIRAALRVAESKTNDPGDAE